MASLDHFRTLSSNTSFFEDTTISITPETNIFDHIEITTFQTQSVKEINLLDSDSYSLRSQVNFSQDLLAYKEASQQNSSKPLLKEDEKSEGLLSMQSFFLEERITALITENKKLKEDLARKASIIENLEKKLQRQEALRKDDAWNAKYDDMKEYEEKVRMLEARVEALSVKIAEKETSYQREKAILIENSNRAIEKCRKDMELLKSKILEIKLERDPLRNILAREQNRIEELKKEIIEINKKSDSGPINESSLEYINQELEKAILQAKNQTYEDDRARHKQQKLLIQEINRLKGLLQEKDCEIEAQKFLVDRLYEENSELKREIEGRVNLNLITSERLLE